MITKKRNEEKVSVHRTNRVRRFAIIAAVIIVLIAAGIYTSDVVSQTMRDQQTQAALHSKPLTSVTSIEIVGYLFKPANVQVRVGTTVTWINKDSVAHTVTFKNKMKDSGLMKQGASFSYTFTRSGTFAYYCDVHKEMIAQVIVTT